MEKQGNISLPKVNNSITEDWNSEEDEISNNGLKKQ
jgi:hypothetical protein